MPVTVEELQLEITADSSAARKGVAALTTSLRALHKATANMNLNGVRTQLDELSRTVENINFSGVVSLKALVGELTKLSGLKGLKLSSTIAKQLTEISAATSAMKGTDYTAVSDMVAGLAPLSQMPKQNISGTLNQLKKIPEIFKSLQAVNTDAFAAKIKEVTAAVKPLADEMAKVASGFSAFPAKLQRLIGSTNSLSGANKGASSSYVNFYAKAKMAAASVKQIVSGIATCISKMNSYIENINLFNVSMGRYASAGAGYADTVGLAMGIDPGEWMRNQGVFMTLATGFGVAGDRAYTMSQNLTQLGYDLSSFFNISYEDAMQKLQSGISGELEPLRRLGYDLSQAKLEATAMSLGIDKSVSSMNQAEKAQLRYYAILTQVTTAQGDMARTLEDPANQMRVFKSAVEQAGRAIGSMFLPVLQNILPYAIAAARVVEYLATTLANLLGYQMDDSSSGIGNLTSGADSAAGALDTASDSAKKLKSYMMGFDELNVISPEQESGAGGIGAGGGGFDFTLPEYDFLPEDFTNKINEIVEKMKEWLGMTKEIKTWSDLLDTNFGKILVAVGAIGAAFVAWKVVEGISSLVKGISGTVNGVRTAVSGVGTALKNAVSGIGTAIKTGLAANVAAVVAIIAGIVLAVAGIYDAVTNGITWINAGMTALGTTLVGLGAGFLIGGPIGAAIGALIGFCIGALTDFGIWLWQNFEQVEAWFTNLPTAVQVAIGVVGHVLFGIIAIIADVIVAIKKWDEIKTFFQNLWDGIVNIWNTAANWFNTCVIQPVVNFFRGLWTSVSGFFQNLWNGIVMVWNTVANWFNVNVITPLVNFFRPIVNWISEFFRGCWILIQAVWVVGAEWFNTFFITPIIDLFAGLVETISTNLSNLLATIQNSWTETVESFKKSWNEDIKPALEKAWKWIKENIIDPLVNLFKEKLEVIWNNIQDIVDNVKKTFRDSWESFKKSWNEDIKPALEKVKKLFIDIWGMIRDAFKGAFQEIKEFGEQILNGLVSKAESAVNAIIQKVNSMITSFNEAVSWAADIIGADWSGLRLLDTVNFTDKSKTVVKAGGDPFFPDYKTLKSISGTFASGGFPPTGQLFIAREAGAELVGSIGSKTAVVNNDQIIAGIAGGVSQANEEQTVLLREQNSLLRELLAKESGVYLDGKALTKSVEQYQRERGRVLLTGGAY